MSTKPFPYKFIDAKLVNGSIYLTIERNEKTETLVLEFGSADDELWDVIHECLTSSLIEVPLRAGPSNPLL